MFACYCGFPSAFLQMPASQRPLESSELQTPKEENRCRGHSVVYMLMQFSIKCAEIFFVATIPKDVISMFGNSNLSG